MKKIDLNISSNKNYPIFIEKNIRNNIVNHFPNEYTNRKFIIITQKKIFNLYGSDLIKNLIKITSKDLVKTIFINDGERFKSFNTVNKIYSDLQKLNANRESIIIAFGGGIVGDISGLVSATFMRGLELINIPTTMLSMIDSSIGGKNGINSINGKNIIGTFYQPSFIFIDQYFLKSIPEREIISGIGEAIKYGIVLDKKLFYLISNNLEEIINLSNFDVIEEIIQICIQLKVNIIKNDVYDHGKRMILNFGHTIGHALESYYDYNYLLHGEAVLYGIIVESTLSYRNGHLSTSNYNEIISLIRKIDLPTISNLKCDKIISNISKDKKNKDNKINFILVDQIGKSRIANNINKKAIESALNIL